MALRERELARVKASPADLIVVGQAWHLYLEGTGEPSERKVSEIRDGLRALLRLLDRPGRRFLIIGGQVRPLACSFDHMRMQPGPLWHAPPAPCPPLAAATARADASEIDDLLASALMERSNAELLRSSHVYCDENCPVVRGDGAWLFLDLGHFTVAGSQLMGQRAAAVISRFLSGNSRP